MDAGDEMARLAIRIYTERNEACHAEIGNPNIASDLQPLVTQGFALGAGWMDQIPIGNRHTRCSSTSTGTTGLLIKT